MRHTTFLERERDAFDMAVADAANAIKRGASESRELGNREFWERAIGAELLEKSASESLYMVAHDLRRSHKRGQLAAFWKMGGTWHGCLLRDHSAIGGVVAIDPAAVFVDVEEMRKRLSWETAVAVAAGHGETKPLQSPDAEVCESVRGCPRERQRCETVGAAIEAARERAIERAMQRRYGTFFVEVPALGLGSQIVETTYNVAADTICEHLWETRSREERVFLGHEALEQKRCAGKAVAA